jgi:DNA-binding MarR family transcriptional regulator
MERGCTMNTKLLKVALESLEAIREFTGDKEIQAQKVVIFLHTAMHREISMTDLLKLSGVEQSSVSRNVTLLAEGFPLKGKPGLGLVEAFEDPAFRRRKLVRITERGRQLIKEMEEKAGKFL